MAPPAARRPARRAAATPPGAARWGRARPRAESPGRRAKTARVLASRRAIRLAMPATRRSIRAPPPRAPAAARRIFVIRARTRPRAARAAKRVRCAGRASCAPARNARRPAARRTARGAARTTSASAASRRLRAAAPGRRVSIARRRAPRAPPPTGRVGRVSRRRGVRRRRVRPAAAMRAAFARPERSRRPAEAVALPARRAARARFAWVKPASHRALPNRAPPAVATRLHTRLSAGRVTPQKSAAPVEVGARRAWTARAPAKSAFNRCIASVARAAAATRLPGNAFLAHRTPSAGLLAGTASTARPSASNARVRSASAGTAKRATSRRALPAAAISRGTASKVSRAAYAARGPSYVGTAWTSERPASIKPVSRPTRASVRTAAATRRRELATTARMTARAACTEKRAPTVLNSAPCARRARARCPAAQHVSKRAWVAATPPGTASPASRIARVANPRPLFARIARSSIRRRRVISASRPRCARARRRRARGRIRAARSAWNNLRPLLGKTFARLPSSRTPRRRARAAPSRRRATTSSATKTRRTPRATTACNISTTTLARK